VPLANASAVTSQTSDKENDMHFQASALGVLGRLAVLSHASPGGKPPDSDEAAEGEKLDRGLSAAGVRGDLDASARLVADQAIFVDDLHASGKTTTKVWEKRGLLHRPQALLAASPVWQFGSDTTRETALASAFAASQDDSAR
jgi:hypothetical protein